MKFAIYGDSFAESSDLDNPNARLNRLAWTTLLAQRLGATSIDYHALGGTSFFYSYQKIMESAHNYDRIIVAVSEPFRYTKKIKDRFFSGPPLPSQRYPDITNTTLRSLIGWFDVMDYDFMHTAQELMMRDIESRWPTAILVPSFPQSFTGERAARWHNFSLLDINMIMLKQLRLPLDHGRLEIRSSTGIMCHIPVEWQSAVANTIFKFLSTGTIAIPTLRLRRAVDSYYTSS